MREQKVDENAATESRWRKSRAFQERSLSGTAAGERRSNSPQFSQYASKDYHRAPSFVVYSGIPTIPLLTYDRARFSIRRVAGV